MQESLVVLWPSTAFVVECIAGNILIGNNAPVKVSFLCISFLNGQFLRQLFRSFYVMGQQMRVEGGWGRVVWEEQEERKTMCFDNENVHDVTVLYFHCCCHVVLSMLIVYMYKMCLSDSLHAVRHITVKVLLLYLYMKRFVKNNLASHIPTLETLLLAIVPVQLYVDHTILY